jgi:hypothetical protein
MGNEMITCKLTGTEGPGINAHIIPESFYLFKKENRQPTSIIQLDGSGRRKKSQKGIYDSSIVTLEGERYFSECDDYAHELLIKRGKEAKAYTDGKKLWAMELFDYEYKLLKLFAISLLWRANATSMDFFSKVSVGERHESRLRMHILEDNPGGVHDYSVFFGFYEDVPDTGFGLMGPYCKRREKIRFYQFQLAYWVLYIKVDNVNCPSALHDLALGEDKPFRAFNLGKYRQSKSFKELVLPNLKRT